jgi:acyl-lipid omega-6 desaturase (Delta-12 desaturase)
VTHVVDTANIRVRNRALLNRLESITYQDVLAAIPKKCFERDTQRGLLAVATHLFILTASYALLAIAPVWCAPILWVWLGTVLWGNFVLAHDCGHQSFSPNKKLNSFIGHFLLLPTLYPYHAWRIMHNRHHAWTNHQEKDNSWRTITPEAYNAMSPFNRFFYYNVHAYFWWFASEIHLFAFHFDRKKFSEPEWKSVSLSVSVTLGFMAVFFPALIYFTGLWGFVSYWLMPWIVFHFWLSTFTLVHHNHPDIPYYPEGEWNPVKAQLFGTVHCKYPWWVELVCYKIGVHIPHHLSTAIPYYNLSEAHTALKQQFPEFIHESRFQWSYLQEIVSQCHLSDEEGYHIPAKSVNNQ